MSKKSGLINIIASFKCLQILHLFFNTFHTLHNKNQTSVKGNVEKTFCCQICDEYSEEKKYDLREPFNK